MKALDAAKLFLTQAHRKGDTITNLKLQKLLYYAQGWHLVKFRAPLFSDKIEAWAFGPVIPSVFKVYKDSCFLPIEGKLHEQEKKFTKSQLVFLDKIYQNFMPYTTKQLTHMTQLEEPWLASYEKTKKKVIPNELMASFYKKLLRTAGRKK